MSSKREWIKAYKADLRSPILSPLVRAEFEARLERLTKCSPLSSRFLWFVGLPFSLACWTLFCFLLGVFA